MTATPAPAPFNQRLQALELLLEEKKLQVQDLGVQVLRREENLDRDLFLLEVSRLVQEKSVPSGAALLAKEKELKHAKRALAALKGERTLLLKQRPDEPRDVPGALALLHLVEGVTQAARRALVEETLKELESQPQMAERLRQEHHSCNPVRTVVTGAQYKRFLGL